MKSCSKINGFTLIELLVSISILAMVAAISVSSYPKFSDQIGVSTETFKVLAFLRETQVYGVAGFTKAGERVVHGIKIDRQNNKLSTVSWRNPDSFENGAYVNNASSGSSPKKETLALDKDKFEISKICQAAPTQENCANNSTNFFEYFIFFRRPNPEARLIGKDGTGLSPANPKAKTGHSRVYVYIRSKKNIEFEKKIVILQTGQMYTE